MESPLCCIIFQIVGSWGSQYVSLKARLSTCTSLLFNCSLLSVYWHLNSPILYDFIECCEVTFGSLFFFWFPFKIQFFKGSLISCRLTLLYWHLNQSAYALIEYCDVLLIFALFLLLVSILKVHYCPTTNVLIFLIRERFELTYDPLNHMPPCTSSWHQQQLTTTFYALYL